jgi:hypothetical protein
MTKEMNESKIKQFLQTELDFRIDVLPILAEDMVSGGENDQVKDDIEKTNDEILILEDLIDILEEHCLRHSAWSDLDGRH